MTLPPPSALDQPSTKNIAIDASGTASALAAPILVGPGSGANPGPTVVGTTETFRWKEVTGATSYRLEVKDVTAGTATKAYAIASGLTTSDAIGLVAGHVYQWSMYAYAGAAASPLSKTCFFTIHAPPLPNPITWAVSPHATGSASISMRATTASDANGVQYYFRCLTAGGHSSKWQASSTYTDTGLLPHTTYKYEVKTRDNSPNHNQGNYSLIASATTT